LLWLLAGLGFAPLTFAAGPPPAGGRDLDGDRLPRGAIARLGTVRGRPRQGIGHMAFLLSGKQLATSGGMTLPLWDLHTGNPLRPLPGPRQVPRQFASSTDSKELLSFTWDRRIAGAAGPPELFRWEVATGKLLPCQAPQLADPWSVAVDRQWILA